MHELSGVARQQVAQLIEAGLLCRHVGYVRCVRSTSLRRGHVLLYGRDSQAERVVDRLHPLGIPSRQVVVEGQHVRRLAAEGGERYGQDGRQRLPLAGLHLDDGAVIEGERGHDLLVERPQADAAASQLANQRKQRAPNGLALQTASRAKPEVLDVRRQRFIGEGAQRRSEAVDFVEALGIGAQIELHGRSAKMRETIAPTDRIPYTRSAGRIL